MASVVLPSRAGSQTARKYIPLVVILIALGLAIFTLPSALNLPQTNPATTLEYAPVPPTDDNTPPPVGNFDNFGLGDSSSIDTGGALGGGDGTLQADQGKSTSTKRCVQTPKGPKQTEDPLAPPCVADYSGAKCKENGGATYQGVTPNEIRLLWYFDSNIVESNTSRGDETRPTNKYFDLDKPEAQDDHVYVRLLRGWMKYFEDRYQLYCRHPHMFVYYGSGDSAGPEAKRADAADNYEQIKPFAVISDSFASNDAYLEAMARRGVLNFGSFLGRESDFFQKFPKLIWGYSPPLEAEADQYVDFVCKQVQPFTNTTFAGGDLLGKPRKYGLVYTDDPTQPQLKKLKDLVMTGIKNRCPLPNKNIPEATWRPCCRAEDNGTLPTYANDAMAKFSDPNQAGGPVTTILWPGGMESKFGDAAERNNYKPEWIMLGDSTTDGFVSGQYQNPNSFGNHAWIVSYQTKQIDYEQEPCFLAYKDADPAAPDTDIRGRACGLYERLRQLFTGIQVAGARLGPTSIDKGFHAIPKIASDNPGTPACFYNLGDYTCVKDGIAMWWDSSAVPPNSSSQGCWKMVNNAKRYLFGQFPAQEIMTMKNAAADQCNGYGGHALTYLSAR
jgi:hypothetical protein